MKKYGLSLLSLLGVLGMMLLVFGAWSLVLLFVILMFVSP